MKRRVRRGTSLAHVHEYFNRPFACLIPKRPYSNALLLTILTICVESDEILKSAK